MLVLPAELTHRHAGATLRMLLQGLKAQPPALSSLAGLYGVQELLPAL